MAITYSTAESNIFSDLRERLESLLVQGPGWSVCDVGGGAHPYLSPDQIRSYSLRYSILDISSEELEKAPTGISKVQCDASGDLRSAIDLTTQKSIDLSGQFDLAFSTMVAEHIADPERFHRNIFELLRPGGHALHIFPSLYTIPFLINKALPESISSLINHIVSPEERRTRDKFPAYYRWCRGPIPSAIVHLEDMGWDVVEYRGYFGHGYYRRIPGLYQLHKWKSSWLERHPLPIFSNYALLWLRKPVA